MKKIVSLIAMSSVFLFENCNSKNIKYVSSINGNIIEQKFDENNKLIEEQEGIKNGNKFIPNGIHKEFYLSGQLKRLSFKEGNRDTGNYYTFYESGKISSINVKTGNKYFTVNIDEDGVKTNRDSIFKLVHVDSSFVGKKIPVFTHIELYGGMHTNLTQKLYYNSNLIWDTTFTEKCDHPFCGESFLFEHVKMFNKGSYNFSCNTTYIDDRSGINILSDSQRISFYAK